MLIWQTNVLVLDANYALKSAVNSEGVSSKNLFQFGSLFVAYSVNFEAYYYYSL